MAFELVAPSRTRAPIDFAAITITPPGHVRANMDATKFLQQNLATRVFIWWDREERKIAIAPAHDGDENSFKLRYGRAGSHFSAKLFFRKLGISTSVRIPVSASGDRLIGVLPASRELKEVLKGHRRKEAK